MTAQTRVTTDHNHLVLRHSCTALRSISSGETNYIYGIQTLSYATTNSAADS